MSERSDITEARAANDRRDVAGSRSAGLPAGTSGSLVLIVSADPSLRRWWKQGLGNESTIEEIDDGGRLKAEVSRKKPSVVLLDADLPRFGGVKALGALCRINPGTKVVLLADSQEQVEAVEALKAGAYGLCNRHIDANLIRKAVETVQKGELWVRRGVMLALVRELIPLHQGGASESPPREDARLRPLTRREREVAQMVAAGARNKDIAASLNITETTVKAHLTAIFRKLGIPDRLRLALMLTESSAPRGRKGHTGSGRG